MTALMTVDWPAWWASLTPEFGFLLLLPLAVAVAGLVADRRETRAD